MSGAVPDETADLARPRGSAGGVGWVAGVSWALGLVLAGILGWSGAAKVADPAAFADVVAGYRIVPPWLVHPAAIVLPWLELAIAVGLLWPGMRDGAALLAAGLLAGFVAAMGSVLVRGIETGCGCFGGDGSGEAVTVWHLLRTAALAAAGGALAWAGSSSGRAPGRAEG